MKERETILEQWLRAEGKQLAKGLFSGLGLRHISPEDFVSDRMDEVRRLRTIGQYVNEQGELYVTSLRNLIHKRCIDIYKSERSRRIREVRWQQNNSSASNPFDNIYSREITFNVQHMIAAKFSSLEKDALLAGLSIASTREFAIVAAYHRIDRTEVENTYHRVLDMLCNLLSSLGNMTADMIKEQEKYLVLFLQNRYLPLEMEKRSLGEL